MFRTSFAPVTVISIHRTAPAAIGCFRAEFHHRGGQDATAGASAARRHHRGVEPGADRARADRWSATRRAGYAIVDLRPGALHGDLYDAGLQHVRLGRASICRRTSRPPSTPTCSSAPSRNR